MTIFYIQSTEKNALQMNDASFASSTRHLRVYKNLSMAVPRIMSVF